MASSRCERAPGLAMIYFYVRSEVAKIKLNENI